MSDQLYTQIGQQITNQYRGTSMGQIFGKPCLKTETKIFAVLVKEQMVFKIGEQEVNFMK
jgi:hypothetical protein